MRLVGTIVTNQHSIKFEDEFFFYCTIELLGKCNCAESWSGSSVQVKLRRWKIFSYSETRSTYWFACSWFYMVEFLLTLLLRKVIVKESVINLESFLFENIFLKNYRDTGWEIQLRINLFLFFLKLLFTSLDSNPLQFDCQSRNKPC